MLSIPESELEYSFSRSSGKGGQNVNKVATRVQLRWNLERSKIISDEDKLWLKNRLKNRLLQTGEIMVDCSEKRSQFANLALARHKLTFIVQNALKRPKKRLKTAPSRGARQQRLDSKRKLSLKKKNRKSIFD